jgi:hypothetical protein
LEEDYTYIKIYGAIASPHIFPIVPDRLVVGEVAYQRVLQGFNASLLNEEKKEFSFHMVLK